jgi:hypothetical protein
MWRVDPNTLISDVVGPANDWPGAKGMATDGNALYVIDRTGELYLVDATTLLRKERVGLQVPK